MFPRERYAVNLPACRGSPRCPDCRARSCHDDRPIPPRMIFITARYRECALLPHMARQVTHDAAAGRPAMLDRLALSGPSSVSGHVAGSIRLSHGEGRGERSSSRLYALGCARKQDRVWLSAVLSSDRWREAPGASPVPAGEGPHRQEVAVSRESLKVADERGGGRVVADTQHGAVQVVLELGGGRCRVAPHADVQVRGHVTRAAAPIAGASYRAGSDPRRRRRAASRTIAGNQDGPRMVSH